MRCRLLLLAAGLASPALAEPTASQFLTRTFTSDAGTTPYRVYVPPEYDGGTALPLLVFLHGAGERGTNNTAQLNNNGNGSFALISDANRAVQPMFMVAPQSTTEWTGAISSTNLPLIVNQLVSTYAIDAARLYVTGISMGGNGTWFALKQYPSLWAAAIPQSGWGAGSPSAYKNIPVWNFHAANDTTVGPAGSDDAVRGLRNAGGVQVIYTRYATGGHGIWPDAYKTPLLFPWLISHRKTAIAHRPPAMFIDTVSVALVSGNREVSATGRVEDSTVGLTSVDVQRVNGATATVTGTSPWSSSGIAFGTNTTQYLLALAHVSNFHATKGGETTVSTSFPINLPSSSSDFTPPTVAITSPTSSGTHSTSQATVALGGTAADAVGVTRVWWENDRGGTGDATGTTSWSVAAVPLVPGINTIAVHARDLTGNIATAFMTVTSTAASADVTSPTVTITGPTSNATHSTTATTVSLSGTASDNVGLTSVTWVNDRGGGGTASGTSSWSASNVALQLGANVVTVVARDVAGNSGTDVLTVTRNAPTYALAVDGGTGSGSYLAGAVVPISANAPPSGKVFDAWLGNVSAVASPTSASTSVTMPASAVAIAASYRTAPPQAPTIATAAAATPNPSTGTTTALSVLGADVTGEATLRYQWSRTSGPASVTFSANGTNAAKASTATFTAPGTYVFTVIVTNAANLTVSSQITVTVNRLLARLTVSPPNATVEIDQVRTFSVQGFDQFNVTMPAGAVQWGTSGGGTIDAQGAFIAGQTAGGPFTITASSGTLSATAQLTVSALPGDLTPPTVVLVTPQESSTFGPALTLSATATDDVAVASVRFEVDDTPVGTVTTPPYTAAVTLAEGPHVARAIALDTAGNEGGSDDVTFTVVAADGGFVADAGEPPDAGQTTEMPDAGETVDAGEGPDAGEIFDAGALLDAGVADLTDAGVTESTLPDGPIVGGCGGCTTGLDAPLWAMLGALTLRRRRR